MKLKQVQRWHQPHLNELPFGAAELLVLSPEVLKPCPIEQARPAAPLARNKEPGSVSSPQRWTYVPTKGCFGHRSLPTGGTLLSWFLLGGFLPGAISYSWNRDLL